MITNTQLNSRAKLLLARLIELGFFCKEKPPVIDQAFELVAAEEGYRNQHVLRAAIAAYVPLAAPGYTAPVFVAPGLELTAVQVLKAMGYSVEQSDWNQSYWKFDGHSSAAFKSDADAWVDVWRDACTRGFFKNASCAAFPRSRWSNLIASSRTSSPYWEWVLIQFESQAAVLACGGQTLSQAARKSLLLAMGYAVMYSDYKLPYWAFEDDSSEDFDSEPDAWANAWRDACARDLIKNDEHRHCHDQFGICKLLKVTRHCRIGIGCCMYWNLILRTYRFMICSSALAANDSAISRIASSWLLVSSIVSIVLINQWRMTHLNIMILGLMSASAMSKVGNMCKVAALARILISVVPFILKEEILVMYHQRAYDFMFKSLTALSVK